MTKSLLKVLVVGGLSLAVVLLWFSDKSPTDFPVNSGIEHNQPQAADIDSDVPTPPGHRDLAPEASASGPTSGASSKNDASLSIVTNASRSGEPAQVRRLASTSTLADDELTEGLAISGLVQEEEGYPIANVEVLAKPIRIFDADEKEIDPTIEAVRSVFTDYDGFYSFTNLIDGEYRVYTIAGGGYASAQSTVRAGATSANLVLVWLRDVHISGIVKSSDGSPLEAVRVTGEGPAGTADTDPDGYFEITVSVKNKAERHALNFKHDGYRDEQISLDLDDLVGAYDNMLLDVTMQPVKGLTNVTGRLTNPEEGPVVGEVVYLRSRGIKTSYNVQSDNNGFFTITNVEPGQDYRLLVAPKSGYKDYERKRLAIPESGLDLQIVLKPLGSGEFSGWLIDTEGSPVPGYSLVVRSERAVHQSELVTSDNEGFFSLEGFPEGHVKLRTESFPRFTVNGIRALSEAKEPVVVVLDLGRYVINGLVKDHRGGPVASPNVALTWRHKENAIQSSSSRNTTVNANGNFEFAGIGAGLHTLRVRAPGYSMAEIKIDVGRHPNNIVVELNEES